MRTLDGLAWLAFGSALLAAAWHWAVPSAGAPAPRGGCAGLKIGDVLLVEPAPTELLAEPKDRHWLEFVWSGNGDVTGLCTATLMPAKDRRPDLSESLDVEVVQAAGGRLSMRPWLERARPTGSYFVRYALVIDGAGGRRYSVGWARFDAADLATAGLRFVCPTRPATTLRVLTAEGQAVPGAVIAVNLASFPLGPGSVLVASDRIGEAVVEGLEPERDWVAELAQGAGPDRQSISRSFTTPRDTVELHVGVRGRWSFDRFSVRRTVLGQGLVIDVVPEPVGELPTVWLTGLHVLPGTGIAADAFVMRREQGTKPAAVSLSFGTGSVVSLDLSKPAPEVVVPPLRARKVKASPVQPGPEGPRSTPER